MRPRRALAAALLAGAVVAAAVVGLLLRGRRGPAGMAASSSAPSPQRLEITRTMMGTWVRVIAYGEPREAVSRALQAAFARMEELARRLSRFEPASDVSRINRAPAGAPVAVGEDTWRVLRAAQEAFERTGGVFDVTVGPLVLLWGGAAERGRLPGEEELAQARARVGFDKVRLLPQGRRVLLGEPGMALDLGGVAKGYIVDEAVETLRSQGITSALVDAGGDIRVLGPRGDGEPWRTAVRNPATEDGLPFPAVLAVVDRAVVTSGNYARYVEIAGRRYTHIIDPRTGWPETEVTSATVVGPDATSADALATALAVLGARRGLQLVESLPGYECLIITGQGPNQSLARSSGFARYETALPAPAPASSPP